MNTEDMDKLDFYEMVEQRNLDVCEAGWFAFKILFIIALILQIVNNKS